MKKVFALMLALTLLTVPWYNAVATGVDLSGVTDEELISLKQQLDTEMLERGVVKTAVLPAGMYTVGEDIPKGVYKIQGESKDVGTQCILYATAEDYKNRTFELNNYLPLPGDSSAKVILTDGQVLAIEITPARITTFSVQWQ